MKGGHFKGGTLFYRVVCVCATELTLKEKLTECVQLVQPLLLHIPTVVVSLGGEGILHCSAAEGSAQRPKFLHYPAAADHLLPATVCSVSGAGDR